jgi:hypothetical protein
MGGGGELVQPSERSILGQHHLDPARGQRPTLPRENRCTCAGVLMVSQGEQGPTSRLVQRDVTADAAFPTGHRERAFAFTHNGILPQEGTQLLHPQTGVEQ